MNTRISTIQQQIFTDIETLPTDALEELTTFLDYLHFKVDQKSSRKTPYQPVKMGGVLKDSKITEEDIAEVRREMWGNFGEREL